MSKEMIFNSIEEAVKELKLDRRYKWSEFLGEIVYYYKYTHECSGCHGGGCHECGYCGKSVGGCPVPALNPETGNPFKVKINQLKG